MFCAISGQVAQDAVFAPKTGLVYEERLIRKALEADGGKCPVTGAELDADSDLCAVKSSPVTLPRAPSGSSFPSLLTTLQNEWDSLLLEQVRLRKELLETRSDLATALYEREAADAVIARLLKENELLKSNLERVASSEPGAAAMDTAEASSAAPADPAKKLQAAVEESLSRLSQVRMSWSAPKPGSPELADLGAGGADWKARVSLTPHSTQKPGTTCLAAESADVDASPGPIRYLVSGGADGDVKILDAQAGQIVGTLKKHKGAVHDVCLRRGVVASASHDKSVAVWAGAWPLGSGAEVSLNCRFHLKVHSKPVHACHIHPSMAFMGTAGADGLWTMLDLDSGTEMLRSSGELDPAVDALFCGRFHPDGKLWAVAGATGTVSIFDIGAASPAAKPAVEPFQHGAAIRSLGFAENGYHMASAGDDGVVKLWDLRKLKAVAEFGCATQGASATALAFDFSGYYLGIGDSEGGTCVMQRPAKKKGEWSQVVKANEQKKPVTGLVIAHDVASIWTGSMDRTVKKYASV